MREPVGGSHHCVGDYFPGPDAVCAHRVSTTLCGRWGRFLSGVGAVVSHSRRQGRRPVGRGGSR